MTIKRNNIENIVAIDRTFKQKDFLMVDWNIGKRCNFDCDYCCPSIHDNYSPHVSLENMIKVADTFLEKHSPENIFISLTGGEPTVNPNLLEICKYLHSKKIKRMVVTTNGTRTIQYYKDLFKFCSHVTFSQHFDQSLTSDNFMKKILELKKIQDKSMYIAVMAHANFFEEVKKSVAFYENHNISFHVVKIRPQTSWSDSATNYSNDYLDWIKKYQKNSPVKKDTLIYYQSNDKIEKTEVHVNEISGTDKNSFTGWKCWAGIFHIHIAADGTIYRGNCKVGGSLGNVNTKFTLPTQPIICDAKKCICAPEITLRKVIEEKYETYVGKSHV